MEVSLQLQYYALEVTSKSTGVSQDPMEDSVMSDAVVVSHQDVIEDEENKGEELQATAREYTSGEATIVPERESVEEPKVEEEKPVVVEPKVEEEKPVVVEPKVEEEKPVVVEPKVEEEKPVVVEPKVEEEKPVVVEPKVEEPQVSEASQAETKAFTTPTKPNKSSISFRKSQVKVVPYTPSTPGSKLDFKLPNKTNVPFRVDRSTPLKQRLEVEKKVRHDRERYLKSSIQTAANICFELERDNQRYCEEISAVIRDRLQMETESRRKLEQMEKEIREQQVSQFLKKARDSTPFQTLEARVRESQGSALTKRRMAESLEASSRMKRVASFREEEKRVRSRAPKGKADGAVREWVERKYRTAAAEMDAAAVQKGRVDHVALIARRKKLNKEFVSNLPASAAVSRAASKARRTPVSGDEATFLMPMTAERAALRSSATSRAKEAASSIPQRSAKQTMQRRDREKAERENREALMKSYFEHKQNLAREAERVNQEKLREVEEGLIRMTLRRKQREAAERQARASTIR